jgi:type IV pilus assembly protein PilC
LLLFIVPAFAEMFRTFQVELPYSTTLVLSLSGLLTDYWRHGLVIVPVILLVAGRLLGIANIRRALMKWCVHLPFVGEVILKSMIARICRTLGTLLHARVPLVDALELAQRTIPYEAMQSELAQISGHVKRGAAMAEPLVESKVFPRMVAQMIAVGEETSELDTMLMKVADYYEQEIDARVERLSTVIEPVIILLLGLFVAGLLIAMYLPMFDLVNVVGG